MVRHLDTVELLRAPLHAYGMRLTGNVWDAEDLGAGHAAQGLRDDRPRRPARRRQPGGKRPGLHVPHDAQRRRARERAILAEPTPAPAATGPDGRVGRIVDYCFAADTMAYAAGALGYPPMPLGYHQDPDTLAVMIASTTRSWGSPGLAAPAAPPPVRS